jgi:hypothetical protein
MARDITQWDFRTIPKTEYHKELVSFSKNPLDDFLESFVAKALIAKTADIDGCVTMYGNDMYSTFRSWRDGRGGKYDVNGAPDLMKKLACSLNLPKGCIVKYKRTNKGQQTQFNIQMLKSHYQIGCLVSLDSDNDEYESDDSV